MEENKKIKIRFQEKAAAAGRRYVHERSRPGLYGIASVRLQKRAPAFVVCLEKRSTFFSFSLGGCDLNWGYATRLRAGGEYGTMELCRNRMGKKDIVPKS